jgi:hypothetical protein
VDDVVNKVFEHWKTIMGHSRARLDMARARVIKARLKDGYTLEDLCLAIDGCGASSFHMGENDRNTTYDAITLILRDADHVDRFMQLGERAHQVVQQANERQKQEEEQRAEAANFKPRTAEEIARARQMLKSAGIRLRRVA